MCDGFDGVKEVHVYFESGAVAKSKRFDMQAEEVILRLKEDNEALLEKIARLEDKVIEVSRNGYWVKKTQYVALQKEYEFQESRLKALADSIIDTRQGLQAKIDALEAQLKSKKK